MLWDNHMHSHYTGDSDSNPLDMIDAAKKKNLRGITFTDHSDHDYRDELNLFDLDIPTYFKEQKQIALEHSTKDFTILTGIEIGLQPHIADFNKAAIESADFDFVIGSTHVVDHVDPYYDYFWAEKDASVLKRRYYEVILENITACPYFDTVGHLDYLFRYVPDGDKSNTYQPYTDIVDAILEKIISLDKALEVNTGALRKGLSEPNPCKAIITRYRELGGRLITLGADAHVPGDGGYSFDTLPALLKDCGFNEFAVYKKRIPEMWPL